MATGEMSYDGLNAYERKVVAKNIDYFQLKVPVQTPKYVQCSAAESCCNNMCYHTTGNGYKVCSYAAWNGLSGHAACKAAGCRKGLTFHLSN
jgi:hypothetical protein